MSISDKAKEYREKLFRDQESELKKTDPEFVEIFENFAFDSVPNNDDLDDRTRLMCILATLLGCQGIDEFEIMLPAAINVGLTPIEIKEIVYQAVDYLGIGRVYPFITRTNAVFERLGISLPLEGQATTTPENRLEKGNEAQVEIFGEGMKEFWKNGPKDRTHINIWLAENCFGDYYTRKGLDLKERELITFCYLAAQGGCEPQLTSHAVGNMRLGNDKDLLIKVVSQNLPYIGYPRTLNALNCIDNAYAQLNK